ncbi:uncharacterized protein [Rutidosis leptorrhynchoides]|uniref:uncharacterized protein n=1 Tax=Rutidosis leptorrhynchoides TaxID=125765 RepID=UPI003A98CEFC
MTSNAKQTGVSANADALPGDSQNVIVFPMQTDTSVTAGKSVQETNAKKSNANNANDSQPEAAAEKMIARRTLLQNREESIAEGKRAKILSGKSSLRTEKIVNTAIEQAKRDAKHNCESRIPRTYLWPLSGSGSQSDRLVLEHNDSDSDNADDQIHARSAHKSRLAKAPRQEDEFSDDSDSAEEFVKNPYVKRKRPPTPFPRYGEEGEASEAARRENAQNFLADAFRSIAPKSMQHKFDQPNFLQDMLTKFCADNTDIRAKKATEITTVADKFVQHISDYPIVSPPIVPATLGVYSGLTDPLDFLQRFEGVVSTYNWDEPVACRVFPMALQGSAREWFHSLPSRSIVGFVDLREKFLLQFQNLLPQKKTHIECHDIKQGNKETLSALLTRYIYECQKIPRLNDQKISGFLHAINPQRHPTLVRRLRRDVPQTFAKVQQETYDYIRGGEDSNITPACGWAIAIAVQAFREKMVAADISVMTGFKGKLDHLLAQNSSSTANAIIMPAEANGSSAPNAVERKAPAVKNLGVRMVNKKISAGYK